jgi:molecular chaperone GrpE
MPSSRASDAAEKRTDAPRGQHEHDHEEQPQQDGPDVAALSDELARSEERYKRAVADLDNYRKRTARDLDRHRIEIRDELSRDWLEVIDSVERALRTAPEDEGLLAILEQMEGVLARLGVRRIGAVGERFDPELHEAISVRESDEVDDRTVLDVARSGFAIGDRVLRPAQVVVSRRPQAEV